MVTRPPRTVRSRRFPDRPSSTTTAHGCKWRIPFRERKQPEREPSRLVFDCVQWGPDIERNQTLGEHAGGDKHLLDHTGSTLYADYYTTNNDYLQYTIDQSNGELNYLGDLAGGPANNSPVSFIGNNVFAYSSSCYQFTPEVIGVHRARDGSLSFISNFNAPFPTTKNAGFFCPWLAAADPTNHLAIAMQPLNSNWVPTGPYQLATYIADSSGNLTTTSTYSNMPFTEAGGKAGTYNSYLNDYWMSPAGNLLAVAGSSGLQVFHFNGANPITKYTGLLTKDDVDQVFWDNANHLYAIGRAAGELWVFTVTPTEVIQAPGSPYSIPGAENLIVLPK